MSALLRGITSKHEGEFYCLNCFHWYSTKDKFKKHKNVCENHDYCYVEIMPKEENKIQPWRKVYESSVYLKSLLEKIVLFIIILKSHQQLK